MRSGVLKVLCTEGALESAILEAVQEAYEIGFLAGQKDQHGELVYPGSPNRPTWMDISLDEPEALARHGVRFKPVVLKSLLEAGYRCLGDLRWIPSQHLRKLYYVGRKTARQIRITVERLEWNG